MHDTMPSWSETLGLTQDPPPAPLAALLGLLARAAGTPVSALWIVDGARQRIAAVHGLPSLPLPADTRLAEQVLQQSGIYRADADSSDPLMASQQLAHFAAVPVTGPEHRPLGLLCVMDRSPPVSDAGVHDALLGARSVLESWLHLRGDALHDPASGAMARRPFLELGDREWRRAMRGLYPIGVLVLQLDHEAELRRGDPADFERCLRAAAVTARYVLHRPGDVACRHDRSRLALMLPGADRDGAVAAADRIREGFADLAIPLPGGATASLSAAVHWVSVDSLSRSDLATAIGHAGEALNRRGAGAASATLRTAPIAGGQNPGTAA